MPAPLVHTMTVVPPSPDRARNAQSEESNENEHKRLLRIARRTARREGVSTADADDIASTVLVNYLEARASISSPVAWVVLVARRVSWAFRRKEAVSRCYGAEVLEGFGRSVQLDERGVDGYLDLRAALFSLDDEERYVVLHRDFGGRPVESIAESTGLSPETVKRRLRRGRQTLKRALSGRSLRGGLRLAGGEQLSHIWQ